MGIVVVNLIPRDGQVVAVVVRVEAWGNQHISYHMHTNDEQGEGMAAPRVKDVQ